MTIEVARRSADSRCRRAAFIFSALCMAAASTSRAANWSVDVGGAQFAFAPATLTIIAGDTVTFVNKGGFHNVAADDGSFRCAQGCDGSGGDGNPSHVLWSATVTFPSPGTIGYHCEIHGAPGLGMFGTITVDPALAPPPPTAFDNVPNGTVLLDVLLAGALILGAALSRRHARNGTDLRLSPRAA